MRCEKITTARMMCSIRMTVTPRWLSFTSSARISSTSNARARPSPRRRSKLRRRRHRARQPELAHLDLRRTRGRAGALPSSATMRSSSPQRASICADDRCAPARCLAVNSSGTCKFCTTVKLRKRLRQLEAAREAQPAALIGRQPAERLVVEAHAAAVMLQRAGKATDQRALARAVRTDKPDALARLDVERDLLEESALKRRKACRTPNLEQRLAHDGSSQVPGAAPRLPRPMRPLGATTTNNTSSTPTSSRLSEEQIVTVAACWIVPRKTAPKQRPDPARHAADQRHRDRVDRISKVEARGRIEIGVVSRVTAHRPCPTARRTKSSRSVSAPASARRLLRPPAHRRARQQGRTQGRALDAAPLARSKAGQRQHDEER